MKLDSVLILIGVACVVFLVFLVGCGEEEQRKREFETNDRIPAILFEKVVNDTQDIFYVPAKKFKDWVRENEAREIVTITSFAIQQYTNSNPTDGFVVVCKKLVIAEADRIKQLEDVRYRLEELRKEEQKLLAK